MSRQAFLSFVVSVLAVAGVPATADVMIDDFSTAYSSGLMLAGPGATDTDVVIGSASSIIGTERETLLDNTAPGSASTILSEVISATGVMSYAEGTATEFASLTFTWNGTAATPLLVDLSEGGLNTEIVVSLLTADVTGGTITITLTDTDSSSVSLPVAIPAPTSSEVIIPFSFTGFTGIDFSSIESIMMTIDGPAGGDLDVTVDYVAAVPEPSSIALCGAAALAGWMRSRRRRAQTDEAPSA